MAGFNVVACLGFLLLIFAAATTGARDDKKMFHGVLFPLGAFISLHLLFFGLIFEPESGATPDAVLFWQVVCFCILAILMLNALLMLPKWKKRRTIWLIGSIIPVCLVVVEVLFYLSISFDDYYS